MVLLATRRFLVPKSLGSSPSGTTKALPNGRAFFIITTKINESLEFKVVSIQVPNTIKINQIQITGNLFGNQEKLRCFGYQNISITVNS